MQSGGGYGVPEVQQFVLGRGSPIFALHGHGIAISAPAPSSSPQQQQGIGLMLNQGQAQALHSQAPAQTQAPPSFQTSNQPLGHLQIHTQQQIHQTHLQSPQQKQHQHQHQQQIMQQLGLRSDSPEPPSPNTSRPSPSSTNKQIIPNRDSSSFVDDDPLDDIERGAAGGHRWPREETQALIKIRAEMDTTFRDSVLKLPLWEEVSRRLAQLGYSRSAKKCKEKFENVHKYYKKTKEGKAGRQDGKSYRFFADLEALYSGSGNRISPFETGGTGFGSGPGAGLEPSSSGRLDIHLSSDSSEEEYDEPGDPNDPENKKRKRKSWSNKVQFFENLVRKVLEKQEAMQKKFLEVLERREQERLMREEAWKRQESARIKREYDHRAQEYARAANRDAALVAFLQKVTGQTLQLPEVLPPQNPNLNPVESSAPTQDQLEENQDKELFDPSSKRWPKVEVHALIRLRSGMEQRFQETGPKGPLWEDISVRMASLGYNRNAKRCKEKWENINKYFRKTKDSAKKRPENSKTCPYFHQLDALYRKGVLGSSSSKMLKGADQIDQPGSNKDDSGHGGQDESGDMMAIVPADPGSMGAQNNDASEHSCSSSDVGSSGDEEVENEKNQQQQQQQQQHQQHQHHHQQHQNSALMDTGNSGHPAPMGLSNFGGSDLFPPNNNLLDLQQHHQRIVGDYGRERDQDRRQQQDLQAAVHDRTRAPFVDSFGVQNGRR